MNDPEQQEVLVIKHGALGDMVLATGPFGAIRAHHARAHITLLTTSAYAEMMQGSGWFDEIWIDSKPTLWQPGDWLRLRRMLRGGNFARVYDLQHSDRTHMYYRLLGRPRPEWSGIAKGASHPHTNPDRDSMHTIERQAEQLAQAGIAKTPPTDISFLAADLTRLRLGDRYALLVPGGARHRPRKRWPAGRYAALAGWLANRDVRPVLIGTLEEQDVLDEIADRVPATLNLCQDTTFAEIAELARHAIAAVGNDTGPMHLIAAAGCPTVVLFSAESVPAQTAPRGEAVTILEAKTLETMAVARVLVALKDFDPAFSREAKPGETLGESPETG